MQSMRSSQKSNRLSRKRSRRSMVILLPFLLTFTVFVRFARSWSGKLQTRSATLTLTVRCCQPDGSLKKCHALCERLCLAFGMLLAHMVMEILRERLGRIYIRTGKAAWPKLLKELFFLRIRSAKEPAGNGA